ncbi:MAG: cystathionine beta-lyase/cystathionine gamma-synthase, partial [Limisphaerales bacterium]
MSNERPNPDYSFLYADSIPPIDQSGTAPIIPALHRTANFSFSDLEAMQDALQNESESWLYTRGNNPTTNLVCEKLAALECTDKALLFGSGMAAISAGILHFVKRDAHIVCVANPYSWTSWMFSDWLKKFGIEVSYVKGIDPEDFRRATKPNTVLYFLESPSSFTFAMQDLRVIAAIA